MVNHLAVVQWRGGGGRGVPGGTTTSGTTGRSLGAGGSTRARPVKPATMGFDGADAGPVASAFVAVTVNLYSVPLSSPVTMIGLLGPEALLSPGEEVTV